jgi:IMP dehydrogenase
MAREAYFPLSELNLDKFVGGGTFDDFILRPQRSVLRSRKEAEISGMFSRNIKLKCPIASANMDSVTNYKLARLMAEYGGIGIIHRGWDIESQAKEVKKVKRDQHGVIRNPYTVASNRTLREAKDLMRLRGVGALLVVNQKDQLVGIITKRDIRHTNFDIKVRKRMTPYKELIKGKADLSVEEAAELIAEHRVEQIPLVGKARSIAGLITSRDIIKHQKMPNATRDQEGRLRVGAAIGATGDYLERAGELINAGVDVLVIDIAHGDSVVMESAVEAFRKKFGDFELVGGNVATFEGTKNLIEKGIDGVKVGIGPGWGCITRISTGFGVPQLQAIHDSYRATKGKIPIIADGGVRQDKDLVFSYLFGAQSVMLGSVFAGTLETPGEVMNRWAQIPEIKEPVLVAVKVFRGMASLAAIQARAEIEEEEANVEGIETIHPLKGSAKTILARMMNNIRSAISYGGARSLDELREKFLEKPDDYLIDQSNSAINESYKR